MIRLIASGLALTLAGSGAVMAQSAQNPAAAPSLSPAKVEARLPPQRLAPQRLPPHRLAAQQLATRNLAAPVGISDLQTGSVPQNAMLDADGRVVPMPVQRLEREGATPCSPDQKPRPSTIRALAEKEAETRGLPRDTLNAVLRAEGLLGGSTRAGNEPHLVQIASAGVRDCAALLTAIQRGISHLNMMRQRYPHPLHHLAAYRDGEEAFLRSGGVPESPETLRFVATALNELAGASHRGASNELAALPRSPNSQSAPSAPQAEITAATMRTSNRERTPAPPDPRWVQGFVLNLE